MAGIFMVMLISVVFNQVNSDSGCEGDMLDCGNGNCITPYWWCDGEDDCLNFRDEQNCDYCSSKGCSQVCEEGPTGAKCFCHHGYTLARDNKTCEGPEPALIFSTLSKIGAFYLRTEKSLTIHDAVSKASSLAVDPFNSKVYWLELTNNATVYSSLLDGTNFSFVLANGLQLPEGIAVDYVAKNLYFTDLGLKQIIVCKIDGSMCHTLHSLDVDKPRAISLDIAEGLVYWSDWGYNTTGIYRSGMDGTQRVTLVSQDIGWPNSIAIDHATQKLYWCDAKLSTIEYITLDGKTRKLLLQFRINRFLPYSLAVFEDTLYVSDWSSKVLKSFDKFTGIESIIKLNEIERPSIRGIQIYHPVLTQSTSNPCWNHSCSHMCLIGLKNSHRCACPEGLTLDGNGDTCSRSNKRENTPSANSNFSHICIANMTNYTCRCADQHMIIQSKCPKNPAESLINHSCPENHCSISAECLTSDGHYYCKCFPFFKEEICAVNVTDSPNVSGPYKVASTLLAILVVCLAAASAFFWWKYRNNSRRIFGNESVTFRNTADCQRSHEVVENAYEVATCKLAEA